MNENIGSLENKILCGSEKISDLDLIKKNKLKETFTYDTESYSKLINTINKMADANCEANFIAAIINKCEYDNSNNKNDYHLNEVNVERIGEFVDILNDYEYKVAFARNLLRSEIIRYHIFEESSYKAKGALYDVDSILMESMETGNYISNNCWYPIRNSIQHIILLFIDKICNILNKDDFSSDQVYLKMEGICKDYTDFKDKTNKYDYEKIQKCVTEILDLFRINMPGSVGHLLWLYYCVGDWLYYQISDEFKDKEHIQYDSNTIRDSLSESIEDKKYKFDILDLERLFYEFELLSETWYKHSDIYSGNPNEILFMDYEKAKSFEKKNQYKRIKKILKRDKYVNSMFYNESTDGGSTDGGSTGGKGKGNGNSCFAIMTNNHDHWVAISGFDPHFISYCNNILKVKGATKWYKIIDSKEFTESLYVWNSQNQKSDKLKYGDAKNKSDANRNKITNSQYGCINRMYSCAERRLLHKFKPGYCIISKKEPCYMCKRVLDNMKIKDVIWYENYTACLDENKYDSIATLIKSF